MNAYRQRLSDAVARCYVQMGGRAFGVSVFAAIIGAGVGESVQLLADAERLGWVVSHVGYYKLTEEGITECVA